MPPLTRTWVSRSRLGRPLAPVVAAAVLLALGVRLLLVAHAGGLGGLVGYDQGVYYVAAQSLVSGVLPYRDFLFLHPPGVALALAPAGLVGMLTQDDTGLAVARLLVVLVGAANAGLVVVAARRVGVVGAAVAGVLYAVWPPVVLSELQPRLEPFVSLGVLVALAASARGGRLGRWAVLLAGCGLGFALGVKIWAVVPVLLVLLTVGWRSGWATALRLAGVAAGTTTAICLPFFLAAPSAMFRMVVHDQLTRGRMAVPDVVRLGGMLDVATHAGRRVHLPVPLTPALLVLGVVLALVVWLLPPARLWVAMLVAQAAVVLASPSFFTFYAAYLGPALALCAGAGAAALLRLPALVGPPTPSAVRRGVAVLVAAACLVGGAVLGQVDLLTRMGSAFPAARFRAAVAHARCVTTDSVGALAVMNVLGRDLRNHCPVVVDLGGLTHDRDPAGLLPDGTQAPRRFDQKWQRDVDRYLRSGQVELIVRRGEDGFAPVIAHRLRHSRLLAEAGGYRAYGTGVPRRPAS